jgi:formate/nitrite transporter FocA (FNT family)
VGETSVRIAAAKAGLDPGQAILRGALCNALVCLAVWLTFAARTAAGKILAILWPISAFVLMGLEHSVANMFLLPAGMLAGADIAPAAALANLAWVTLGNVIGGAGGVALAYRHAYLGRAPG